MIRHDFWMHRARVFLFLLLIACRAVAAQELLLMKHLQP